MTYADRWYQEGYLAGNRLEAFGEVPYEATTWAALWWLRGWIEGRSHLGSEITVHIGQTVIGDKDPELGRAKTMEAKMRILVGGVEEES